MKAKKILIVTQELDPHADPVILRLRALGHQPVRVHPADMPLRSNYSVHLDSRSWRGTLRTARQEVDLEDIRSIWWRRPGSITLPEGLSKREKNFAKREVNHALHGLWGSLDCYWMSHPDCIRQASWKPAQLRRAKEMGFEIPRTLFTQLPDEVLAFSESCGGRVIFKVMSDPSLGAFSADGKRTVGADDDLDCTYATLLTREHLAQHVAQVTATPCQFQEYVEKRVELRVTIIGDELFVAEIDSQAQERTKIDWRHYDVPMLLRKGSLPPDIAARCMAFVKSYGLNFSAMDLILTPDGRYVFLESNPNGQWGFVEDLVPEMKMLDALVGCLIRGGSSVESPIAPRREVARALPAEIPA